MKLRLVKPAVLFASAILASLPVQGLAAGKDTPGISPTTRFTPVTGAVMTVPQPVKMSDGRYHLAYELLLTNATGLEVEVDSVEVRDAAGGRVILSLAGDAVAARMNPIGEAAKPGRSIAPSATSIVWLDATAAAKDEIPPAIDHRIAGSIVTPGGKRPFESIVTPVAVNLVDPVVLRPPVPAGTWLMSEGCCTDPSHHRDGLAPINGALLVPQRFAIDLFRLDDEHRTWVGDPKDLASYLSYSQPVLSAAAGTVVAALDGLPDQQPPEPPPIPPIGDTVGNHVIVEIGRGAYLLYAHMKPGSIAVDVGDRVTVGQQIGLIGTTGNSTTPHLHFQVLTTPTFFPADSTPYVFDRFDLLGRETERLWDDNLGLQPTGTLPFEPAASPGPRENELPLDRDIVTFR
jgi:hypothetical protein